jgi:hypothetical protein
VTQPWTPPDGLEQQPRGPQPYGPPSPPNGLPLQRTNGSHPQPWPQPRPSHGQPARPAGPGRHRAYERPAEPAPQPPQPQPADRESDSRRRLVFGIVAGVVALALGLWSVAILFQVIG